MSLRLFCLLALALLGACSSDKPIPEAEASVGTTQAAPALPAHMRELTGMLSCTQGFLPAGGEVEVALLVIDERDRPQQMLASEKLLANGAALPFRLMFNPQSFPNNARVELRARVSQSGQLAWRLRPVRIFQPQSQTL